MELKKLSRNNKFKYAFLPLSSACEYHCIFCTSDYPDKENKIKINKSAHELKRLTRLLTMGRDLKIKKLFLGGDEPFTHPFIQELLLYSAQMGYKEIAIHTSGLQLADKNVLNQIAAVPATFKLYIPVYGAEARVHDAIVRKPGSFKKLNIGLRALKRRQNIKTFLHSIVLKQNYLFLDEVMMFSKKNFPEFNFEGFLHFKYSTYPKKDTYKDLMPSYKELSSKLKASGGSLLGFPVCILKKAGITKNKGRRIPFHFLLNQKTLHLDRYPDMSFRDETASNQEIPVCLACKNRKNCIHPYSEYIHAYGDAEFRAIN